MKKYRYSQEEADDAYRLKLLEQFKKTVAVVKDEQTGGKGSKRKLEVLAEDNQNSLIDSSPVKADTSLEKEGKLKVKMERKALQEINSRVEKGLCANPACKGKKKVDIVCDFKFCFLCCFNSDSKRTCSVHLKEANNRISENKLIEEALIGEKRRKFRHFEEKLAMYGQTVLIWCLRDFCQNKKFSEDTMTYFKKQERYAARQSNRNGDLSRDRTTGAYHRERMISRRLKAARTFAKVI
jgi:hypothetical protein